jgi:hypothetical protein
MLEYTLIVLLLKPSGTVEVGREYYQTIKECQAASHTKMLEYGSMDMYNMAIECRRNMNENIHKQI